MHPDNREEGDHCPTAPNSSNATVWVYTVIAASFICAVLLARDEIRIPSPKLLCAPGRQRWAGEDDCETSNEGDERKQLSDDDSLNLRGHLTMNWVPTATDAALIGTAVTLIGILITNQAKVSEFR